MPTTVVRRLVNIEVDAGEYELVYEVCHVGGITRHVTIKPTSDALLRSELETAIISDFAGAGVTVVAADILNGV